ncbi:hypothetical protein [Globicatella sulfidifaciens]|uniref:Uncharacterized protein n=1 Tax=Globicatella sulfidifaciens TaxID=136093 RepID=A0A7X8C485_9LACT|nr:hypothetical protein [Globicatella sulfidifaciens]NLJ18578.1 hypothetical protein [Globicatella sulfidifaciens]
MAFKFNPNLDYQNDAVKAVVDLFKGQESTYSNLTVYDSVEYPTHMVMCGRTEENENGVGNKLLLDEDEIVENLREVQKQNHLKEYTGQLKKNNLNFAVEMETGTRVIIVIGCINVLVSRVSGTLVRYNSCIA